MRRRLVGVVLTGIAAATRGLGRTPRRSLYVVLIASAVIGLILSSPVGAEPPQIAAKRAEAQRVLNEIQTLDSQLGKAIEAYNGANDQLAQIEHERAVNNRHLKIARNNLTIAQKRLGERLRAIYTSDQDSVRPTRLRNGRTPSMTGRSTKERGLGCSRSRRVWSRSRSGD